MRNCANQYKIWPVMYDQPLQIEDLMWEIGKMVWINGNLTYEWAAGGVLCVATAGKRPSASFLKPLHCNVFHFHYIVFNYITFNACHFISLSIFTLHCVSFLFLSSTLCLISFLRQSLHYNVWHFISLTFISLRCVSFHFSFCIFITLCLISLLRPSLHYHVFHFISLTIFTLCFI